MQIEQLNCELLSCHVARNDKLSAGLEHRIESSKQCCLPLNIAGNIFDIIDTNQREGLCTF
jgi:hypothetical protein